MPPARTGFGASALKTARPIVLGCALAIILAAHFRGSFPSAAEQRPPTPFMKDMTSPEIRSAIEAGRTTVILPTGGIEQNGPHMVLGKHDYIVSHAAGEIAMRLGDALVAPVVSFVPEGAFEPATDNMRFAGTIGLSEPVFEALLEDIARSLKSAGFKTIVIIGDHGQSQAAQMRVARRLSEAWVKDGVRVEAPQSYYDDRAQYTLLHSRGETDAGIGVHAGLIDTSELLGVKPDAVYLDRAARDDRELARLGASGRPEKSTAELGRTLLAMRIDAVVAEIKALQTRR